MINILLTRNDLMSTFHSIGFDKLEKHLTIRNFFKSNIRYIIEKKRFALNEENTQMILIDKGHFQG